MRSLPIATIRQIGNAAAADAARILAIRTPGLAERHARFQIAQAREELAFSRLVSGTAKARALAKAETYRKLAGMYLAQAAAERQPPARKEAA